MDYITIDTVLKVNGYRSIIERQQHKPTVGAVLGKQLLLCNQHPNKTRPIVPATVRSFKVDRSHKRSNLTDCNRPIDSLLVGWAGFDR